MLQISNFNLHFTCISVPVSAYWQIKFWPIFCACAKAEVKRFVVEMCTVLVSKLLSWDPKWNCLHFSGNHLRL